MKRLFPLVAVAGMLAACGDYDRDGYCDHCNHHKDWSRDALSDRPFGSSRDTHGNYVGNGHQAIVHDDTYVVAPAVVAVPTTVAAPVVTTAPTVVRPDGTYVVRPDGTYAVRPDGTYYVTPVIEDRGQEHHKWEDPLSDRSLGNSRGAHNEPMTNKDMDNDQDYDYVPDYRLRGYQWRYGY